MAGSLRKAGMSALRERLEEVAMRVDLGGFLGMMAFGVMYG